jgi:hypothetical protein
LKALAWILKIQTRQGKRLHRAGSVSAWAVATEVVFEAVKVKKIRVALNTS